MREMWAELTRLGTKMMQQATQLQVSPNGQSSYQPIPNLPDKAGILRPQLQMSPSGQSSYQPVPSLPDKAGTLRPQLQMSPSGQSSYQPVPNLQDKAGTLRPQLQMSPSGQSSYQPVPNLQDKAGTLRPQLQMSPSGQSSYQPVPNLQDKAGTLRPQLQMSPSGKSSYQPVPNLQVKAGTLRAQPTHEPPASKETLLQQPDKDETVARRVPRLRAVVESQAFKNVLVDEMDMMLSRAATLIQANWRGYQLRQKLISQMMAAKAIQEAWRRFNTRRLLRSGKTMEKKAKAEEGDIPYHPPQLVRFLHPEEGRSLLTHPTMVSKETQFPSSDSLATYTHQLALQQSQGVSQPGTCSVGGPSVPFLPHQTVAIRLPCPVSPDAKGRPCLFTRTIRSACLVHAEGHTKTRPVTARANKAGTPGPPPSGRCAQAVQGQLKIQTQTHMEAEVLKVPPAGPAHVITKTPLQPCPGSTVTTKTPPQIYLAAPVTKMPPQMYPAVPMTKTPAQTCPAATMAKTPPQVYPPAPATKTPPQTCPPATVTKTPLQACLAAMVNKIQRQPCPGPAITITKTPPQPCPATPVTKTPAQMRPSGSMTNTSPQTRPAATMTKASPQLFLLASMIRSPTQTQPAATMTKAPPQMWAGPAMAKAPPQTWAGPVMAKAPPQVRPAATVAKTPLQTSQAATMAKTPSHQRFQGASVNKTPPPQTRLAAMITKTPAQLRSVATILRTLCLPPPAAGHLKPPFSAAAAAGTPDSSSHTCLSGPKAKAVVNARQAAGVVKVSSRSYLTEGKVKCLPPSHLGAGAPKAPARPPLEVEKIKAFSQKQMKTETVSDSSMAVEMPGALSWAKVAEDRNKQARLRMDVVKGQSQVCVPVGTAGAHLGTGLLQAQPAPCTTTGSPQAHLLAELTKALPQAHVSTKPTKDPSRGHPPAELAAAPAQSHLGMCLSKAQSQAHLATEAIKVQSQVHLRTGLTKARSQAQLVTETAKSLYATHQAAELSSKTQSQPLLVGFQASTQPCQHVGTLPRAKPEDRLTQLPAHSFLQGKVIQGPCQGASETQNMLVPLLASAGHTTCNVESWGDSGATRAQPSTTSPAPPCQEELAASQLASLCVELATLLGSQEDLRALLAKALSHGEVRAALNQALSKEVLGASMAKALPQGILGAALAKALPWGELGTTLARALSRGELWSELTKAIQGRLAEVLSKALTEEELATLNQALCQGELGAVLSQSLSQAGLRSGVVLPKAAAKTAGRGMPVMPTPVEVDCRGRPSAAWRPTLGPMRLQPSKGPEDAGVSGGQAWNSAVPSVAVRPPNSTVAPGGAWEPARGTVPWDVVGSKAAVDPRRPGELVASVQAVEKIIIRAVVIIQACTRGFLVRRTIKVWHQWAIVIQAAWRGYCVRRDLARLCRAATIIQAAWRGFRIRQSHAQQVLLPGMWAEMGSGARTTSDHRCFQSCQPHACSLCQSLSSGLGSPPSVVMLVGSSPRTCHTCGHTLPTRVVHGTGRGAAGQASRPRGCISQSTPRSPRQPNRQNKAATAIQSAWRGFTVRRQLRQQQLAAKMLQATWRGHSTRASLTTDALLGPAMWDNSRHTQWPGV
ncbi:IQ domain-containing protein N [Hippopotamus amphibius kiboko]|uniref:IQ domain-containing protein N n=1 Tax=Hippopotamus amphibius kiboko TaxID=575201 RepID=UPI0025931673|nr:IQ domain-containing protein N [Hippopotamus amphibius kiboko]